MVMMEKPSPIQVGREFVRQYYTLLNKAPDMLYRFYSMKSSYVHGGRYCDGEPETSVIGQKEINTKIKSLEFRDCHTKIRQVDAHSTVGSGVVVQVTGELSNCGLPLRRFMQTFVLAPQGDNPFKFYVHNDIFRYQDEVFNDEVQRSDVDEEQESDEEAAEQDILPEATNQVPIENFYNPSPTPLNPTSQSPPVIMSNGLEQEPQHVECTRIRTPSPTLPDQADEIPSPARTPSPKQKELTTTQHVDQQINVETEVNQQAETQETEPEQKVSAPPKTFSWADLASKNTPAVRGNTQQGTSIRVNQPETAPAEPVEPAPRSTTRGGGGSRPRGNRDEDRGGGFGRNANNTTGGNREQAGVRYPDNQQIFVGNLPYEISDSDLKEHFSAFGNVIEVRINHSHTNNPSFGFIIFEDPKSVIEVLDRMPTQFRSHRINIEEKKHRSSRENNRRMGQGESRRGPMGDMKGNRRGQGGPQMMKRDRQGTKETRDGNRQAYNNAPRR